MDGNSTLLEFEHGNLNDGLVVNGVILLFPAVATEYLAPPATFVVDTEGEEVKSDGQYNVNCVVDGRSTGEINFHLRYVVNYERIVNDIVAGEMQGSHELIKMVKHFVYKGKFTEETDLQAIVALLEFEKKNPNDFLKSQLKVALGQLLLHRYESPARVIQIAKQYKLLSLVAAVNGIMLEKAIK